MSVIYGFNNPLNRNYQTISTNRFVVDSPRFWRKEFHPRFKDIFTIEDFHSVITSVNDELSIRLSDAYIDTLAEKLENWFSGFRFSQIPDENPQSLQMFLAALYFTLLDYFGRFTVTQYPITDDLFNVITKEAYTAKRDNTRLTADKHNIQNDNTIVTGIVDKTVFDREQNTDGKEHITENTINNNNTVEDTFLSPQNSGAAPNSTNAKDSGVGGVSINTGADYSTTKVNQSYGENTNDVSDTERKEDIIELTNTNYNSDTNQKENLNEDKTAESQELANQKEDHYKETSNTDVIAKLQQLYDLDNNDIWFSILGSLSQWILYVDIATSEKSYVGFKTYE